MTTTKKEDVSVKKEMPVLKKRTAPEETIPVEETAEKKSPLKKRSLPTDTGTDTPVVLKKSTPAPTEKKEIPLKGKKIATDEAEQKEKSSLDKMRERIAAQKKLEQDIMNQQSLKNQEKVSMRSKLSALQKDLSKESEYE